MDQLKKKIRHVPDFPKAGIQFKDITPVLSDARLFSGCIDLLTDNLKPSDVDAVVGIDARGFIFFTNYESRKAQELLENPHASLTLPWVALERQVIISGSVTKTSREESLAYYNLRPRGSRLGAWVSTQSKVIPGRQFLEERLREIEHQYPGEEIPLPPYWGGYLLTPDQIEFWQGRPNRLHDRFRYTRQSDNQWIIERLAP